VNTVGQDEKVPALKTLTPLTKPLSIIVADDVEGILHLLQDWLGDEGHQVTCAACGREVIAALKRHSFDLIITDVIMPDGDGIELMNEAKRLQPGARVIAISGGGSYLRATDCLALAKGLGAHAILMKPFNRQQLVEAIERVMPAEALAHA